MADRKFLTSVADVFGYDQDDNIIFTSKTLLDSSIEVSLGSNPVRGGRGNQLQYVYYHTGEMNFTLTDTQWNLAMLGSTIGTDETHTDSVYVQEDVVVSSGPTPASGKVSATKGTPLAFEGTDIYGWVTDSTGTTTRISFSGVNSVESTFTPGTTVCLRYLISGTDAGQTNTITVKANMIPKVIKLVMEAQLNSADVSTNKIGTVQIIAPRVTLSGAFSISMTADGVSNTPLTGMALAYVDPAGTVGCSTVPYYAKLTEIIDESNWYDNVRDISIAGGNVQAANTVVTSGVTTWNLDIWAIPNTGSAYQISGTLLGYQSSNSSNFSVANGVVTANANAIGTTAVITANITGANTILDAVTFTITGV